MADAKVKMQGKRPVGTYPEGKRGADGPPLLTSRGQEQTVARSVVPERDATLSDKEPGESDPGRQDVEGNVEPTERGTDWAPGGKFGGAAAGGYLSIIILWLANLAGLSMDQSVAGAITGLIMIVFVYLVPQGRTG